MESARGVTIRCAGRGTIREMRAHKAMTLIEMMIVMVIMGTMLAMAVRPTGRIMVENRVQRAANLVASDLELAFALAARQRQPVRLTIDGARMEYLVSDRATGDVYQRRILGNGSEYELTSLSGTAASVDIFPGGLAASPLTITIGLSGYSRRIMMTRAGQVRVAQ